MAMSKANPSSKQLACRKCKFVFSGDEKKCPVCGSTDLSDEWSGLVIIMDPASRLAEVIGAKREGRYAIRVR
jgi:DNA-directed RNA polymerase subunit E"